MYWHLRQLWTWWGGEDLWWIKILQAKMIAEALIPTAFGILVGVFASFLHTRLISRKEALVCEVSNVSSEMLSYLNGLVRS